MVMLGILSGNAESAKSLQTGIGKVITALSLRDNALHFTFSDGSRIRLYDAGQNCCEYRHMQTDDDLAFYVGAVLQGAEVRGAPPQPGDEDHEIEFLMVMTSKGLFTMANHNEHNGYYGGFNVCCAVEGDEEVVGSPTEARREDPRTPIIELQQSRLER